MSFNIISADITSLSVDAIVNPTDSHFSGSGNTDFAVHAAAGSALRDECASLRPLEAGCIAVTGAYGLPCRYVFHTVGPVWQGGGHNEEALLRSCYVNAMLEAGSRGLSSIAFPLISSGTFGFPKDRVLEIAISAIRDCSENMTSDIDVTICIYNRSAYEIPHRRELEAFLFGEDNAVMACSAVPSPAKNKKSPLSFLRQNRAESAKRSCEVPEGQSIAANFETFADKAMEPICEAFSEQANEISLDEWLSKQDDTFAVTLLKLIDKKGMNDVECYKKARISKQTFWKINNDAHYKPGKTTVLAFAIALELSLDETQQFLRTVGMSLSHSSTFDMIVEYYIRNGIYDLYTINSALFKYDQICIGC